MIPGWHFHSSSPLLFCFFYYENTKDCSKLQQLMQMRSGDEPCDDNRDKRTVWRWRRAYIHQLTRWRSGVVCSQIELPRMSPPKTTCRRLAVVTAPPPGNPSAPSLTWNALVKWTFVYLYDDSMTYQLLSSATNLPHIVISIITTVATIVAAIICSNVEHWHGELKSAHWESEG